MPKKKPRKKILFVIPSLRAGGAERVMSFIAQNLDDSIFDVNLLVVGFEKDKAFDVDSISVTFLNKARVSRGVWGMIKKIKNFKPDVVIGAIGHLNAMLGALSFFFPKLIFIGREVNVASVLGNIRNKPKKTLNIIPYLYQFLDTVICQSNDMANDVKINTATKHDRIVIINNPITDKFKLKEEKPNNRIPKFITVGSLEKRKGHWRLLDVLSKLDFDFEYTICFHK